MENRGPEVRKIGGWRKKIRKWGGGVTHWVKGGGGGSILGL